MVQSHLLLVIVLFVIHFLSAIAKLPLRLLIPSVLVMATYGAFGLTGTMAGQITLLTYVLGRPITLTLVVLLAASLLLSPLLARIRSRMASTTAAAKAGS